MKKQTAGRDSLGEFAPKFAELNDDVLFGEVWGREDKLSLKSRCMTTIASLIGKGGLDSSFKYHLINAKNNGITKEELVEIITHLAFYCGWPNAWAAFNMAKEVYTEDEEGWYQEEGKEPQSLKLGDVVTIPANVKHWHGAKNDSWFSHLAVEVPGEDTSNEWCEKVTDEEYDKL